MRNWAYRGQPDSLTGEPGVSAGAEGGGDIDLAAGFPDPGGSPTPTDPMTLAMSSLLLTNSPTQRSTDRCVTIRRNPAGSATSGVPIDDRQWNESHGPNTVYMLYRTVAPTVTQILRSTDGGLVYNPPAQTAGAIGQVGYIDVHQKTGTVHVSGSTGQVCHSTVTLPTGEAAVYQCSQAATDPNGVAHIFFPVKVAVTKLNQFAPKGAISNGLTLAGLRAQSFTPQANGKRDITRGGTEYVVGNCGVLPPTGCGPSDPTSQPTPSSSSSVFQFELTDYPANEDCTAITVGVVRGVVTDTRATVDIASSNGTATRRGDFTFVVGRLVFEPGETRKTFRVLINEDAYTEGAELATLSLQNPQNGTLGATSSATLRIVDDASEPPDSPIDNSRTFVCTHYHDFLYRQADQSGEDFWTQNIESCGNNARRRIEHRQDVSTAFFLSIEFQQTGYFVIRAHRAAFGSAKSTPRYAVFLRDQRQISNGVIVGQPGFQQQLDTNKQRYLEDFVTRAEMVRALIESIEYRGRFAGSSDRGNQQGTSQARVGGAWAQELVRAAPTLLDPLLLRFILPG